MSMDLSVSEIDGVTPGSFNSSVDVFVQDRCRRPCWTRISQTAVRCFVGTVSRIASRSFEWLIR